MTVFCLWLKSNQWIGYSWSKKDGRQRVFVATFADAQELSKILQCSKNVLNVLSFHLFRNTGLYFGRSWKTSESSGITFLAFFSTIFLDKVCAKDRLPSMEWNVIAPGFMAHVGFNLPETGIAPLIALQGPQIQSKENEDGYIALLLLLLQRRSNAKLYIYFSFLTFIAAHER